MKKYFKFMVLLYAAVILAAIALIFIFHVDLMSLLKGVWNGIRAPIAVIMNIFGSGILFYDNPDMHISYNIGFILGLFQWNSPFVLNGARKKNH